MFDMQAFTEDLIKKWPPPEGWRYTKEYLKALEMNNDPDSTQKICYDGPIYEPIMPDLHEDESTIVPLVIIKSMNSEVLYNSKEIVLENFDDGQYKVTFFNEESHWAGDITFTKEEGVIYDSVKEPISVEKVDRLARGYALEELGKEHYPEFGEIVRYFKAGFHEGESYGNGGWISVKDKLPEKDEDIFVAIKTEDGQRHYTYLKGYLLLDDIKRDDGCPFDYWMKIPKITE